MLKLTSSLAYEVILCLGLKWLHERSPRDQLMVKITVCIF